MSLPIDRELTQARVPFSNAGRQGIAEGLAVVGYTPDRRAADLELLEETQDARQDQLSAQGEQKRLTADVNAAQKVARDNLSAFRKILKAADRIYPEAHLLTRLGLEKALAGSSLGKLVITTTTAYEKALTEADILEITGEFGYGMERLPALLAQVEALVALDQEQEVAKGRAQGATDAFYKLMDRLRNARAALRELAQVAFADTPQVLEELGLGTVRR